MSRFYSYLNSASAIIDLYKGEIPFSIFLKQYFAKEKKFGSKDRKQVSSLCFNYFRVSNALICDNKEEQLLLAIFLCETNSNPILALTKPALNDLIAIDLEQKNQLLGPKINVSNLFPLINYVSNAIDKNIFAQSITVQPDLFIRLRPHHSVQVVQALTESQLPFYRINDSLLGFPNATKLPETLMADKEYTIQDASSQEVGNILKEHLLELHQDSAVWDCCAASGGKSIMMHDLGFKYKLFVSDIRESILVNLSNRFKMAGIEGYTKFLADLTVQNINTPVSNFDLIIADVPCSGSGTWGRTPEQLSYFKSKDIEKYSSRQLKIVTNLMNKIKSNGLLVYITCSVFESENENIVSHICQNGFSEIHTQYILGYGNKADSMFLSILIKN